VILSSALWTNYLPLLVVATYVVAPVPNWLCGRAADHDDFMESGGSGIVDLGRFLTGFFVVMGIGMAFLPASTSSGWPNQYSSIACALRPLRLNQTRSLRHEHHRWSVDIWYDSQLHDVLQRIGGVLVLA